MNNTFVLKRFFLLFRKHSIDNIRTYSLLFGGITAVLLVSLSVISSSNHGIIAISKQFNIFFYSMLICGSILTSLSFSDLGSKNKAIAQLVLPASHFEKFVVSWLYSYFIFQLLFVVSFYIAGYIVMFYVQQSTGKDLNLLLNVFSAEQKAVYTFLAFAFLHSLYFWGAIFFKNLHFLKTGLILLGIILLLTLVNKLALGLIIDRNVVTNLPFEGLRFIDNNNYKHIYTDERAIIYGGILLVLIVIVLWISSFFTLQEKEI